MGTHGPFVVIARCSEGACFETLWVPGVSFTAVRLGSSRFQRCPVHGHFERVRRVDPGSLTEQERAAAAAYPSHRIP